MADRIERFRLASIPFPQRYIRGQKEQVTKDILDTFKKVEVSIPLDAIKQISNYAKFLKDLYTNKRKFKKYETVALSQEVSAVLQRRLPQKMKDPGNFTIPYTISGTRFEKALLDLGASINLMPFSVYEAMDIGELQDTNMSIQLADRSVRYPRGVIENVLVKVNNLILPADFFVLDMEDAPMPNSMPLILGCPFMATTRTKIDVFAGTLTMTVLGDTIEFKIFDVMKYRDDHKECFLVDIVDSIVQSTFATSMSKDPLERALTLPKEELEETDEEGIELVVTLEAAPSYRHKQIHLFEPLPMSNEKLVHSIVQAPKFISV